MATAAHSDHITRAPRAVAVARATLLNRLSLAWNAIECVVAIAAGVAAGSVSLIAFGVDSAVEVSSSVVLAWRLRRERAGGCQQEGDRTAQRLIAGTLVLLAAWVTVEALRDLVNEDRPDASVIGVALTATSLAVMPWLARAKRRLAPAMGSRAVEADATQTRLCAWLSGVVLVGLVLNAVAGWWWADPTAALGVAVLAGAEARRAWRAESFADTCCD